MPAINFSTVRYYFSINLVRFIHIVKSKNNSYLKDHRCLISFIFKPFLLHYLQLKMRDCYFLLYSQ